MGSNSEQIADGIEGISGGGLEHVFVRFETQKKADPRVGFLVGERAWLFAVIPIALTLIPALIHTIHEAGAGGSTA